MEDPKQNIDKNQKDFEAIEKYVLKQLSPEELVEFERRIETNPEFSHQVKEVEILIKASQEAGLRSRMDAFHEDLTAEKTKIPTLKSSPFISKRYLLAAAVALLFVSGIWFLLRNPQETPETFAQFYQLDPGLITRMSIGESYEFNRAMVDYKSGKYDAAIQIWGELHQMNPENDSLSYFLGSAHLAKLEPKQAIPYFQIILPQQESAFYEDCLWYLSLAYLLDGDREQALEYLDKSKHPDKEKLSAQLRNTP